MSKSDQQWAEEIAQFLLDEIGAAPGQGNQRWNDAVARVLAEVRHQEREACAKEVPTSWLDSSLSGPDAVLSSKSAGRWGCPDIERLLKAIQNRIRSRKDD